MKDTQSTEPTAARWTRLHCSRCRYTREHPGPVSAGDLEGACALCRAPLGAVTVFRVDYRQLSGSVMDMRLAHVARGADGTR